MLNNSNIMLNNYYTAVTINYVVWKLWIIIIRRFGYDQGSAFQCKFSILSKLEVSKNIIINFSMNKEFDKKIVIEVSNNIVIIY
jgi:hypothetical protein